MVVRRHRTTRPERSRLKMVAGEQARPDAPMGLNDWNAWATTADAEKSAPPPTDGLQRHGGRGYLYVNVDDAWEGSRDAARRHPGQRAVRRHEGPRGLHPVQGLKLGIYSSPGRRPARATRAASSTKKQDAHTWAAWGIDFLKYDWCSYGEIGQDGTGPSTREALPGDARGPRRIDRDIVYSLCQYGMGEVWTWGADVGGNCGARPATSTTPGGGWRGIGFCAGRERDVRQPGHWNDPDMLVVGLVGWGPNSILGADAQRADHPCDPMVAPRRADVGRL